MKFPSLALLASVLLGFATTVSGIGLNPSWGYTYAETEAGKQLLFVTPLNAGSDGSVAFVATRSDGGGGGLENQVFWLRANDDGSSPTAPLWVSGWVASAGFTDIVAVRRDHLVFAQGRDLKSVTLDASGTPTVTTVKAFAGATEGGDPLVFTVEQARAPGFVFAIATREDKRGFTLSAFRFSSPAPVVGEVATITSVSGTTLSISFRSELGVNYQLQESNTVDAVSWQNVGGVIAGNGQLQTLTQTTGVPKKFFRVVAL